MWQNWNITYQISSAFQKQASNVLWKEKTSALPSVSYTQSSTVSLQLIDATPRGTMRPVKLIPHVTMWRSKRPEETANKALNTDDTHTPLNNRFHKHITSFYVPKWYAYFRLWHLFFSSRWWLWKQQCNIQTNDDVSLLLTFQVWMTEQRRGGWVESSYCRVKCPARQKWVHEPLWGRGGILQSLIAPDIGFSCSFSFV